MREYKQVYRNAQAEQRDYITPEDITAALEAPGGDPVDVAIEVLEALGKQSVGVEDDSLCAFIRALRKWSEG